MRTILTGMTLLMLLGGCAEPGGDGDETAGKVSVQLGGVGPTYDVVAIEFSLVDGADPMGCDGTPVTQTTVLLDDESLPPIPDGGLGEEHPFAETILVVPVGSYFACAAPLDDMGNPSMDCQPTQVQTAVIAGTTTNVVIVAQCAGDDVGGVDLITVLNSPPQIEEVTIDPSTFITTCETANFTAMASDPDGDDVTFSWALSSGALPPEPGLVSRWDAEGTASDSVGTNHGAVGGAVTYVAAVTGTGFALTGVAGDSVDIPDAPSLRPAHFTMAVWANRSGPSAQNEDTYGPNVFVRRSNSSNASWHVNWRNSDGRLRAGMPGGPVLTSAQPFPELGAPRHVALTYDGATIALYVDGGLEASAPFAGPIAYGDGPLVLGSAGLSVAGTPFPRVFNGVIDGATLHDRALTPTELLDLQAGPPAPEGELTSMDDSAAFSTTISGEYEIEVTVTDSEGAEGSLAFPMHVSDCAP